MSLPRGQFKRPYTKYVPTTGEAARVWSAPVAPLVGKDEWARAQYRAASRGGASKQEMESRYSYSDLQVMDAHVDQMFWQMVRHEMRTNPKFVSQMEFIENFYEVPQHEFLERIKMRYWAQMQVLTDDRQHRRFLNEVFRAWHAAREQIEPEPLYERAQRDAAAEMMFQDAEDQRYYDDQEMIETLESLRY